MLPKSGKHFPDCAATYLYKHKNTLHYGSKSISCRVFTSHISFSYVMNNLLLHVSLFINFKYQFKNLAFLRILQIAHFESKIHLRITISSFWQFCKISQVVILMGISLSPYPRFEQIFHLLAHTKSVRIMLSVFSKLLY